MAHMDVKQASGVRVGSHAEDVSDDPTKMAERFKKSFSREVQVHFVGAWSVLLSLKFHRTHC